MRSRRYDIIEFDEDQVLVTPLTEKGLGAMETIGRPPDPHDKNDVAMVI